MFTIANDGRPKPLALPGVTEAVCFVGRDGDAKGVHHLVLGETACDALRTAVQGLSNDNILPAAHASLAAMNADLEFFNAFELGLIELPANPNAPKPGKGKDNQIYMHFVRNQWAKENEPVSGDLRKSPLVMKVSDLIIDSGSL